MPPISFGTGWACRRKRLLHDDLLVIYRTLLEDDFEKLPPGLRVFHSALGQRRATGVMTVRHQNGWLARSVGFPHVGEHRLRLEVVATRDWEEWTRWFGATPFRSTQWIAGDLLMEAAGPVRIAFRVTADENEMRFESRRVRVWGMPIPLRITACARGDGSAWWIEVEVAHVGSYSGKISSEIL